MIQLTRERMNHDPRFLFATVLVGTNNETYILARAGTQIVCFNDSLFNFYLLSLMTVIETHYLCGSLFVPTNTIANKNLGS